MDHTCCSLQQALNKVSVLDGNDVPGNIYSFFVLFGNVIVLQIDAPPATEVHFCK